jgi:hypothetical protein
MLGSAMNLIGTGKLYSQALRLLDRIGRLALYDTHCTLLVVLRMF